MVPEPKLPELPTELWVVFDGDGTPNYSSEVRSLAMQHAAEMAGVFPEDSPWRVQKYRRIDR